MRHRLRAVIAGSLVVAVACVGGCSGAGARPAEPKVQRASAESTAVVYPVAVTSTEGTAPALTYKEYQVPGWGDFEGYGERFATIKYTPRAEGQPTTLSILDFTTAKWARIVDSAVNFEDGFDILGVSSNDHWVAWEEVKGDEQAEPFEVLWKLYAAKIDAGSMKLGKPVLVDESEVSMHSRPLLQVDGDLVYWMTNSTPNRRQEGVVDGALVESRDLVSGVTTVVCETTAHWRTMSVQQGKVIVDEMGRTSERALLRVIDPATAQNAWSLDLRNTARLSHFPQVHDGALAWTVYTSDTLTYPDLFYRGTDGVTRAVRRGTSNPQHVGRYVFYTGIHVVPNGVGMRKNLTMLGGYDTETNTTFTIIEGDPEDGAWWRLPMVSPYSEDTFVVSNDLAPFADSPEAAAKAPLCIRRYTVATN
ncbi:MAG: hypothetical protein LLG08_08060 [Actinomycetia bacterium]|nr:hypothetical protein [Actinomycetes bacterium]